MTIDPHSPPTIDFLTGALLATCSPPTTSNPPIISKTTYLKDLSGVFQDIEAYEQQAPDTVVYRVDMLPSSGKEGELNFGVTHLAAGCVGDEYFMTRGHFHQRAECGETYIGLTGEGLLLLQDGSGNAWSQRVFSGSVHQIPGFTAHRLVNTGSVPLAALASWPAVAGHDYASLRANGFNLLVRRTEQGFQLTEKHHE